MILLIESYAASCIFDRVFLPKLTEYLVQCSMIGFPSNDSTIRLSEALN